MRGMRLYGIGWIENQQQKERDGEVRAGDELPESFTESLFQALQRAGSPNAARDVDPVCGDGAR